MVEVRANGVEDRGLHTIYDDPTDKEVLEMSNYLFHIKGRRGLQNRLDMHLCHSMLLRSEDSRQMDLSRFFTLTFANEGTLSFFITALPYAYTFSILFWVGLNAMH